MFKIRDIVGVPDGRRGIIEGRTKKGQFIIQIGSGGPYIFADKDDLRYVDDQFLTDSGGRNFYAKI